MARNETGGDESGVDEIAAPKSPVPTGFWGRSPQPPEACGLWVDLPEAKFRFAAKLPSICFIQ